MDHGDATCSPTLQPQWSLQVGIAYLVASQDLAVGLLHLAQLAEKVPKL